MSLFDGVPDAPIHSSESLLHAMPGAPLAERMRPRTLAEYSGQEHLLGPGKPLRVQIEREGPDSTNTGSMILWGPPGVGKTTLAKIIAETTKANFVEFSAVMSGIKEIKQVMVPAAQAAEYHSRALDDSERGLGGKGLTADEEALALMASYSSGDCRAAYNTLEVAAQLPAEGAKHIDKA